MNWMPTVTQITPQRRAANRRNVYLDGAFAFGCNLNVIARFRLQEGQTLSPEQVEKVLAGGVRQESASTGRSGRSNRGCIRAPELKKKLMKKDWPEPVVDGVLDDLQRMNYLDDAKFAVRPGDVGGQDQKARPAAGADRTDPQGDQVGRGETGARSGVRRTRFDCGGDVAGDEAGGETAGDGPRRGAASIDGNAGAAGVRLRCDQAGDQTGAGPGRANR